MTPLLQALATETREINAANGWGLDFDPVSNRDTVPCYLALIHSEISEAAQADAPEEVLRELGDVIVRCLDFCELLKPGSLTGHEPNWAGIKQLSIRGEGAAIELLRLHTMTSNALEAYRKMDDYLEPLIGDVVRIALRTWALMLRAGADPEAVIREILAKNRTRGYRHGGRRT